MLIMNTWIIVNLEEHVSGIDALFSFPHCVHSPRRPLCAPPGSGEGKSTRLPSPI